MVINFISSKDSDKICIMRTKSNNIEIMMSNETYDIIEELFESLLQKISRRIRRINEWKWFFFDSVDLLIYELH